MGLGLNSPLQGNVKTTPTVQQNSNSSDLTQKDFGMFPVPIRLRYDPSKPFHFGVFLNVSFGIASTFGMFELHVATGQAPGLTTQQPFSCSKLVLLLYWVGLLGPDVITTMGVADMILVNLASSFEVSYDEVSQWVPVLRNRSLVYVESLQNSDSN